jgi:hypothetical protein
MSFPPTKPRSRLLQRGVNKKVLRLRIVLYLQQVWLAAGLTVLDIALPAACGLVHRGGIPLATTRALKT